MHPRTHELLQYLDAQRAVLRAAFDSVPADLRSKEPAPGRWSPNAIIEHLAIVDGRVAGLLSMKIAEGRAAGSLGPDPNTDPVLSTLDVSYVFDRTTRVTAPEPIRPTTMLDGDAAWAALEQATIAVRASVMEGDGLALDTVMHPHPRFGPISLYHWIAVVGAHEARHAAQIRECVAVKT
jgi:hypothetical protein